MAFDKEIIMSNDKEIIMTNLKFFGGKWKCSNSPFIKTKYCSSELAAVQRNKNLNDQMQSAHVHSHASRALKLFLSQSLELRPWSPPCNQNALARAISRAA